MHAYLGNHPNPPQRSLAATLPFYMFSERDLFAIFRPEAQAQAPRLRAAIRTLKLLHLDPELSLNGVFFKADRNKKRLLAAERKFARQLELPNTYFEIMSLPEQIKNECVFPYRSGQEMDVWGGVNSADETYCTPLISRISDILKSESLASIFKPGDQHSLFEIIDAFLQSHSERLLVISMQYLSFAHHAREIVANCLGRHLLNIARQGRYKKRPLLVALDEAHDFLKEYFVEQANDYPLDSFALMAKEARKYSLSLGIATQRP